MYIYIYVYIYVAWLDKKNEYPLVERVGDVLVPGFWLGFGLGFWV